MRASPSGVPYPSSTLQPVELPTEGAAPSAGQNSPRISFGDPSDDQMLIAALEGEPSLSGDGDPAALLPSCVVALSELDLGMAAMLFIFSLQFTT